LLASVVGCGSSSGGSAGAPPPGDAGVTRAVKVVVVNMSSFESTPFRMALGLDQTVSVPGLPRADAGVHCNADDVCELTTGMGYANAATSMTVLLHAPGLDLTHAYFIIAGIGGIDPAQGTLGTAAWAKYAVDFGLASEIDAREAPTGWSYGYFGIGAISPMQAPAALAGNEVFALDATFLQTALSLSRNAKLEDSSQAASTRAHYPSAPANQPPVVTQCDVASGDTWIAGTALTQRARDWTKLLTQGAATFCASAQEDNATLEVLTRGAAAGLVDMHRVALLRSASDFSAPYPGQTDAAGLLGSLNTGGLAIATSNLAHAAQPVIAAIVSGWSQWRSGVPKM
jgi:purine nucleoside permease